MRGGTELARVSDSGDLSHPSVTMAALALEGVPSPDAWDVMVQCGGFDLLFGRALLHRYAGAPERAMTVLCEFVGDELEAARHRYGPEHSHPNVFGAPDALLATIEAYLAAPPRSTADLARACRLLAERVTGLDAAPGTFAYSVADAAALMCSIASSHRADPSGGDRVAIEVDARRLLRALASVHQHQAGGELRDHAEATLSRYRGAYR